MNLVSKLAEQPRDRLAIIDRNGQATFGDLTQRVEGGIEFLRKLGLSKGDSVVIFHPVDRVLYEILLSCFGAGLVVVLVDPAKGHRFLKKCFEWISPKAFVGSPKAQLLRLKHRGIPLAIHTGKWLPFTSRWRPLSSSAKPEIMLPGDPALVTFTSGTTGEPKGLVRSHGFLLAQDETLSQSLDLQPGQVDLVTLPVFLLSNLNHGVTSVIADTDLRRPGFPQVDRILRQVIDHKVTRSTASPAFFEQMPEEFFTEMNTCHTGGAPVFPDLLSRFPAKFHAVYGSSEAEPIAHFSGTHLNERVMEKIRSGGGLPAGKPIPKIDLRLIDDEILVAGEHVLEGYLDGRGDKECKLKLDGKIWHRTGDAGRVDDEGYLWLLGRHSTRWKGFYPLQIEAAVRAEKPGIKCAFFRGLLVTEEETSINLQWAPIDRRVAIEKIPMDSRHNAKVNLPALEHLLRSNKLID